MVQGVEVTAADAAVKAAKTLGWPVVLKVAHEGLSHKSDVGGVVLNVNDEDACRAEVQRLLELAPGARMLVEAQALGGLDLIVGAQRDPVLGPAVMVGMGGIFAEILDDMVIHVGTPTFSEARAMVGRLKGAELLQGARGQKTLFVDGIAQAIIAAGGLMEARPDITELDINPLRVYPDRVCALDALISIGQTCPASQRAVRGTCSQRVDKLFNPSSVAVVGPSRTQERAGNIILKNLATFAFPGAVYPVNPAGGEIEGLPAYPTVAACPGPVDTTVVAVPYQQVDTVMQDVAASGCKHVIMITGGFSDAGPEGKQREVALLEFCGRHGIFLMGPNSIGTLSTASGFCTAIGKLPPMQPSGISVFGQSGILTTGFALSEVTEHGLGFSRMACIGNKADLDECDFLEYLAKDPGTTCIGMYLEGLSNGPRFMEVAASAAKAKPVVVLKTGRTAEGARAAASHTGAMAGSDAVFDALCHQSGMLRVHSFVELFSTLRVLDMCQAPRSNRVGIVSISGAGCVLASDACGDSGLELAPITAETQRRLARLAPPWAVITNPADIWSTIEQKGPGEAYRSITEVMLRDDNVDMVLVVALLLEEGSFDAAAMLGPLKKAFPHKPMVSAYLSGRKDLNEAFSLGCEREGIPVFNDPVEAVMAMGRLFSSSR